MSIVHEVGRVRYRAFVILLVLVVMFLSACNQTEDILSDKQVSELTRRLEVFDVTVPLPPAIWVESEPDLAATQQDEKRDENSIDIHMYPDGERGDNWTIMYSVLGTYSAAGEVPDVNEYANSMELIFVDACGKENLLRQDIEEDVTSLIMVLTCASTPNSTYPGFGPGTGVLVLYSFYTDEQTAVRLVHEWKGDKFDLADKSTWPVNEEELNIMIARFKDIEYTEQ